MLHRRFVNACREDGKTTASRPALCEFTHRRFSPVILALSYYATLLRSDAGSHPRILLILCGDDFKHWKQTYPERALQLQTWILVAASWLARNHGPFLEAPFTWASTIDDRLPLDERRRIRRTLYIMPRCRVETLFMIAIYDLMHESGLDDQLFEGQDYEDMFTEWARRVRGSSGIVE